MRSSRLTRKVGLAARSVPMRRQEMRRYGEMVRVPLQRSGRHRARSTTQRVKDQAEDAAKAVLLARASDVDDWPLCEVCGVAAQLEYQHRKRRPHCTNAEFWDPRNALAVCAACHRLIHDRPIEAKDYGWEVEQDLDPAGQPVFRRGGWVQLVTADVDVRLFVEIPTQSRTGVSV